MVGQVRRNEPGSGSRCLIEKHTESDEARKSYAHHSKREATCVFVTTVHR